MPVHKYKNEIAGEYGFDRKTLYNRLRKCELLLPRGLLSPEQQKKIYDCLGYPAGVKREDYEESTAGKENKKTE